MASKDYPSIQLNADGLLGFRLLSNQEEASLVRVGSKTSEKTDKLAGMEDAMGSKVGEKRPDIQSKLGAKIGSKVGVKDS